MKNIYGKKCLVKRDLNGREYNYLVKKCSFDKKQLEFLEDNVKDKACLKIIKILANESSDIIFKGSFFFQKLLGVKYREYNDIDFNFDSNDPKKMELLRNILLKVNKYMPCFLRKDEAVYQFAKIYYDFYVTSFIRVECLTVAPHIKEYNFFTIFDGQNSFDIKICTIEKMFIDKLFSLFYFFSKFYNYDKKRINTSIIDLMYFLNNESIKKIVYDEHSKYEEYCMAKIIDDNLLHFNHYYQQ